MNDPLKDWYADPSKQQQLKAALDLTIVKEAMALLQRVSLPRADFVVRSSADAITHAAMEQKRSVGFFSYPEELASLTEKPEKPPTMPEGYSDPYVIAYAKAHGMWDDFSEKTE